MAWMEAHQSCSDALLCERMDPPKLPENSEFCSGGEVAAPGADGAALAALTDAWRAQECSSDFNCGSFSGTAECVAGTCQFVPSTACETCPLDLEPSCTAGNQNALNPCWAEHCLKEEIAHPGFCADSPECTAAGGTCEEVVGDHAPCPDGTRWDREDPEKACPGGNVFNTCCVPWGESCTFLAGSMTLMSDPFTCAPLPEVPGEASWMCLHQPQQTSCTLSSILERPLGHGVDAAITMTAQAGSMVTVQGTHNQTGRTFVCTGKVSFDVEEASAWECETCDDGGSSCRSCAIEQTWICML